MEILWSLQAVMSHHVTTHDKWIHHLCIQVTKFINFLSNRHYQLLSPFSHELPTQTQLPHAALKENKLKNKEITENPIFFSLKKGIASLSFLSLLLTVTSLERSLRSLGTSNDTQELQDGL